MADPNYSWVYLIIFLAIPLARIIPRILSKYGIGKNTTNTIQEKTISNPALMNILKNLEWNLLNPR